MRKIFMMMTSFFQNNKLPNEHTFDNDDVIDDNVILMPGG